MATTWIRVVTNGAGLSCVERLDDDGNFFRVSNWMSTIPEAEDIMCGMTYLKTLKETLETSNATQDSDEERNIEIEVQEP